VTPDYFDSVSNVVANEQATLRCSASSDINVDWYYQQCCEHLEHGMHLCANPTKIATGTQYQIRRDAAGETNLLINGVGKNDTGIYVCKNHATGHILSHWLLNVLSKYASELFCLCKLS